MDELKREIKEVIISTLQLEDITPENIVDSEPLFGAGLGLDGGRLLFLIIEAIKGKPVKHEAYINMAGMLLLMLFAMYILFKDIINLF